MDEASDATHFCYCAGSETFLCEEHVGTHEESHSESELFVPLPLSALDQHLNFGYYDRLKVRLQANTLGLDALDNNLAEIDRCIEEISTIVEEVIWKLNDFACRKVKELKEIRAKIQFQIEEARLEFRNTLYDDFTTPIFPATVSLRNFVPGSEMLTLFQFSLKADLFPPNFDQLLTYTVRPPQQSAPENSETVDTARFGFILPKIESQKISFFDFERKSWRKSVTVRGKIVSNGHRFVLLSDNTVFLCGGRDKETVFASSFVLDSGGKVQKWADMQVARFAHGLVCYLKFVYSFGGQTQDKESSAHSELMKLTENRWETIAEMPSPRKNFVPTVFQRRIYLCGGSGNTDIDVFELEFGRMRSLNFRLPEVSAACLSFVQRNEMVVVLKNTILRFREKENRLMLRGTLRHDNNAEPYAKTAPVVYGTKVFVSNGSKCVVYDTITGKALIDI